MQTDPTATAVTTDPTATAVTTDTTDPTDTAVTADPEPIGVGSLLTRTREYDGTVTAVVTSVDNYYAYGRDATGYRHSIVLSTAGTAGSGWQRAESVGSGVTAILASLAGQLTTAETRLRTSADTAARDLQAFRDRVRDVAMEYAERNDWCAEVARALAELDIHVEREVTVTGTFSVSMTLAYGEERPSAREVLDSLDTYDISVDDVTDND